MAIARVGEGAAGEAARGAPSGVAFLVSAGVVYEVVAACCSSPQTTEINADTRADTLMKWVHLGLAQSAVLVAAAAWLDPQHRTAIIMGGATAGVAMYAQYVHARAAGLASSEPGTEDTGGGQGPAQRRRAAGGAAWGWAA